MSLRSWTRTAQVPGRTRDRHRTAAALGWAAVLCCVCTTSPSSAQPAGARRPPSGREDRRKADQAVKLHDEARALYEAGEYRKAITKLEQAVEIDPEGKELVYNLALIHEKLGEMDPAGTYYQRYLEMETDPALRERTQKALKRIEGAKKELAQRRAEEARHEPTASSAPAAAPFARASIAATPAPTPSRRIGPGVWASGGIAVAALLVGNVFAISALVKNPGSGAHTGDGVGIDDLRADAESAHRRAVVADVSFIVAALAAGTGAVLFLTTPIESPRGTGASRDVVGVRF